MTSVPDTVEEGAAPSAAPRGPVVGPRVAAGVLLVVGIVLLANAIGAAARDGVTLGGPRLAPLVVTAGWVVLAAVYCVQQILRPQGQRFALSTPLLVVAALVGYALVLKYTMVGYVIATAVFFLIIARLLSIRPIRDVIVRDLVVAVALSLGIYLAFTRLLGISLPSGVLPL